MRTPHLASVLAYAFASAVLACAALPLGAQDLGGLPGRLDWRVWRGDSVDVVTTPATLDYAARVRALTAGLLRLRPLPLGGAFKSIDLVVQPATVVPNGFVSLQPWSSYLYATPPQDQALVGSADWTTLLTVHEYRHVEQFTNLLRGWTRVFYRLGGNAGWSLLTGLSTPNWFTEGDAVYAETALTGAGRGRTPGFTALQRAVALDGVRYPYAKARNGSLRSRVPDHYPLGFALVRHGRLNYGDPWAAVVRGAGTFWPPAYPFSRALNRETGLGTVAFYEEAYDSLAAVWAAELDARELTDHTPLDLPLDQLTVYASPLPLADSTAVRLGLPAGTLLAERRSQTRIRELVRVSPNGAVTPLVKLGASVDVGLHAAAGRVAYTQVRNQVRRPNETYSTPLVYDLATDAAALVNPAERYLYSPGLRPDGRRVVASQVVPGAVPGSAPALVELDVATGERTRTFDYPGLLLTPRYTPDGQSVVALAKCDGHLAYVVVDLTSGGDLDGSAPVRQLTAWTRHVLGAPFPHGDHVYYSAGYTGTEQVFRVPLDGAAADGSGAIEQVTEAAVAARYPATDGERLYFTEVQRLGDPVSVLPKASWRLSTVDVAPPEDVAAFGKLPVDAAALAFRERYLPPPPPDRPVGASSQNGTPQNGNPQNGNPEPRTPNAELLQNPQPAATAPPNLPAYCSLGGFRLNGYEAELSNTTAQVRVFGETILNDYAAEATVGYIRNEESFFYGADVTVARLWPWVEIGFAEANRRYLTLVTADTVALAQRRLRETTFSADLRAPLSQRVGAYSLRVEPSAGVDHRIARARGGSEGLAEDALTSLDLGLEVRHLRQRAPKQILPRWGQQLDVRWQGSVSGVAAAQTQVTAGVFLPGARRSHGARARVHYRDEALDNEYQYPDFFPYARGFGKLATDRALTYSLDYHFPLLYPDVGVAGIVYARRLRAAVWVDHTDLRLAERTLPRGRLPADVTRLTGIGVDVTLDATLFNAFDLPITVRFPYRVASDAPAIFPTGFVTPELIFDLL